MKEIIMGEGLTKIFRRGREEIYALRNVDFSVIEGEFISIIGPSGSGKTALLNVLGCLDTPDEGSLRLNGIETKGMKEGNLVKLRRENIGFVFQQFYLMPTLTARENIELPLLFSHKNRNNSIDDVLNMVGLADRGDHLPGQLSGGEMQRAALARAIAIKPEIILADEPTGNLDAKNAWNLVKLLSDINALGTTVLMTTHNLDIVSSMNKTVYTIYNGELVVDATSAPKIIKKKKKIKKVISKK